MTGIYFPGCEVSSDDEKLRLLTKDQNNITAATAVTRVVSKYYSDIISRDISQYYVDILLNIAGENIYSLSLKDVLNAKFDSSLQTARACKQLGLGDNESLMSIDEQEIFGLAIMDYVCSMSYQGQTAQSMYGYDIIKHKCDELLQSNKDYIFARAVYEYLELSGYKKEAEDGYIKLTAMQNIVSDNNNMVDENEKE